MSQYRLSGRQKKCAQQIVEVSPADRLNTASAVDNRNINS